MRSTDKRVKNQEDKMIGSIFLISCFLALDSCLLDSHFLVD